MNYKRIIPRLDIKDHNLVKGINLEGLRVLGEPEYFANLYTKEHADEIIYQDTVASLYGKSFMLDVINKVAKISEYEGHHPDISFGWGYAEIKITTHAIEGLSENDFILAAKIDQLINV